jgi:hypothetical protein
VDYLHQQLDLSADDVVEVTLDHPANVMLLSPSDFDAYRNGREFRYEGGYARSSPIRIAAPHAGIWHLVVDLGGGPGSVRAGVAIHKNAVPA